MSVAVTILAIMQPDAGWYHVATQVDYVSLDAFIPVFLEHDRGRCSLSVDRDEPVAYTAVCNNGGDVLRDAHQLFTLVRKITL